MTTRQGLDEIVVHGSSSNENEIVVSFEARPLQEEGSGVVFTAVSSNLHTASQQSPDTCCTCTN
ncbi:hypothetical protein [Bradyrhizobium sp. CCBAU 25338]|uniref:hypothetical protein n=1 Tax=Bradyrhizobium sp. CCBAU 25338 TaxID=1641877 RepID=UPI0023024742|nr:hypothetical protein [Bradyrhizobium sp. CCBAU 25338]